jgi:dTDP-4-dehydrorhamnose 3,5-epimerase
LPAICRIARRPLPVHRRHTLHFEPTLFQNARLIVPAPHVDARGSFTRTHCEREFRALGLEHRFPQHSISISTKRATLRGMHFQTPPHAEVKIVRCLKGAIYDVIIDLNRTSSTFLRWQGFELTAENAHQLYVPKGFAHGFLTLTDDAHVSYLISEFYEPAAASGVRYDDPAFAISWPFPVHEIADKDRNWPKFII